MSPEPIWTVALMAGDGMPYVSQAPVQPHDATMVAQFAADPKSAVAAETLMHELTTDRLQRLRGYAYDFGDELRVTRIRDLYGLALSVAADAPYRM